MLSGQATLNPIQIILNQLIEVAGCPSIMQLAVVLGFSKKPSGYLLPYLKGQNTPTKSFLDKLNTYFNTNLAIKNTLLANQETSQAYNQLFISHVDTSSTIKSQPRSNKRKVESTLLVETNEPISSSKKHVTKPSISSISTSIYSSHLDIAPMDLASKKEEEMIPATSNNDVVNKKFYVDNLEEMEELSKIACFSFIHDTPRKPEAKISVGRVSKLGDDRAFGVFAEENISGEKSVFLGYYLGKKIPSNKNIDISYVMNLNKGFIDARLEGNETRFYNSTTEEQANAYFQLDAKGKVYIATKKGIAIKKGQAILVYYGDNYKQDKQRDHSSQNMIFLNPSDTMDDSETLLATNNYAKTPIHLSLELRTSLGLSQDRQFYVPKHYHSMLDKKNDDIIEDAEILNLPILAINPESNKPYPVSQQEGITLLMLAAYNGDVDAVKWLVSRGANINQLCSTTGYNATFFVVKSNQSVDTQYQILQYLIINNKENCQCLTNQDSQGLTPLHWYIQSDNFDLIKLLATSDNEKVKNQFAQSLQYITYADGLCPISYAFKKGKYQLFRYLLNVHDSLNKKTHFSRKSDWIKIAEACSSAEALVVLLNAVRDAQMKSIDLIKFIRTMQTHATYPCAINVVVKDKIIIVNIDKEQMKFQHVLQVETEIKFNKTVKQINEGDKDQRFAFNSTQRHGLFNTSEMKKVHSKDSTLTQPADMPVAGVTLALD